MIDLCKSEYKNPRDPHMHHCKKEGGHTSGHQCDCTFYWVDETTIYTEVGKKSGKQRYRLRLTKEGLVFLGFIPDPDTLDDGRRPRGVVTEDDLIRWEHGPENARRIGYRSARAGAHLRQLLRGD